MARGAYKSFDKLTPAGKRARLKREKAREEPQASPPSDPAAEAEADRKAQLQSVDQQARMLGRLIKVKRAQDSLQDFCELMMPDPEAPDDPERSLFVVKPHHRLLIAAVEAVESKRLMRSAYSMPPQHGKTSILSLFGVAWIIGRNPHMRIIIGTYSEERAQKVGSELRSVLQSDAFRQVFPKCVMKKGSKAKDDMEFTGGGSVLLRGRGTGTTGQPCDLFLIDDPLKDEKEAGSAAIRQQMQDWYAAVVQTRCPITTPIMIVHTRWHEDDLIGWLCDPEHPANQNDPDRAKRWTYLNIPAVVKDKTLADAMGMTLSVQTDPVVLKVFGDEPMCALWDERFPLHHLAEAHGNSPRIFASVYLGMPSPEDGDLFRDTYLSPYVQGQQPDRSQLRIYAASDHAVGTKQRNDLTCILIVGVDREGVIWLLDCWWEKAPSDRVGEKMLDLAERWRPIMWWAERGHITQSMGPFLRRRMQERKVYINLVEQTPAADKTTRGQSMLARAAQGMVRFPKGAAWYEKARAEMLKFPNGRHDDFWDAFAHIGLGLDALSGPSRAAGGTRAANGNAPKVGTLGWVKYQSAIEGRRAKTALRLASM